MAGKGKYFHVQHKQTGDEQLVRAGKPAEAIAAVAGDRTSAMPADNDAIADFYTGGGELHPNSAEAGSGKMFFVPAGDGRALVRAKNAGEAFGKVNGSDLYETKLLSQDELVELLGRGLKPVVFQAKQKSPAASGETTDNAGTADGEAGAEAGDAQGAVDAGSEVASEAVAEGDAAAPADTVEATPVNAEAGSDAAQAAANEEGPADAAA